MLEAATITEQIMNRAIETIGVGVRQCDVARRDPRHRHARHAEAYGGDYAAIVPLMPTGVGTSGPHITWRDEPFLNNTGTTIEIAGVRRALSCAA